MDHVKVQCLVLTTGVLSVCTAYFLWKWYTKKELPPKEWKHVGTLMDLMCFPIKSCGVFRMPTMECTDMGLKYLTLKDRDFAIIDKNASVVTARVHPETVLIQLSLDNNTLTLNAPNMDPITIDLNNLPKNPSKKVLLWGQMITGIVCGDHISQWLSKFLLNQETGMQLVHFPEGSIRMRRSRLRSLVSDTDSGAFADLTTYSLINQSSIDNLNERIDGQTVDTQNFRPNFVIKGAEPYEEDRWKWVQIGDVTFKVAKLCTRCVLTTVNWKTGVKDEKCEPLATLKTYRMIGEKKHDKGSPVMGVHLALYEPGLIKIGDPIYVSL